MIRKAFGARPEAIRDSNKIVDHYLTTAGDRIAERFIDALEATYAGIATEPQIGSTRYAHELGVERLRSRRLKHFPYLVFYVELDDRIEVWRVLHAQRDIPRRIDDGEG
ncbi:type II toxin-antitoxin system RelE/ParE family toxin [Brevundimonas subvibrioides]|uniref:type II toxin-antitoxin system RelE/ParE family toxin n=1 Tax=Brevundimonas subvibrioides TaxID=74313 RepID=UPI0022B5B9FD|nr:type II toxin-antitoxin system RelE/ParE family toxin [Brevundimonas subvibrioides]